MHVVSTFGSRVVVQPGRGPSWRHAGMVVVVCFIRSILLSCGVKVVLTNSTAACATPVLCVQKVRGIVSRPPPRAAAGRQGRLRAVSLGSSSQLLSHAPPRFGSFLTFNSRRLHSGGGLRGAQAWASICFLPVLCQLAMGCSAAVIRGRTSRLTCLLPRVTRHSSA